jgi:hypothetical protein
MGEEDANTPNAEDTVVLTAEDMKQIQQAVPEDEKPKEEE